MLLQAVSMLLYLGLSIYFILSVYSYYIIIRIQRRSVIQFLDHEFEATEGGPTICNVIIIITMIMETLRMVALVTFSSLKYQ